MRPQKLPLRLLSFLAVLLLTPAVFGQSGPMDELTLGLQQRNQIFSSFHVIQNTQANAMGEKIFRSLLETSVARSARRDVPWELTLLASDDVNAFSTAGGKVYVTSGMMERVLGLNYGLWASVLGHEVGHVLANHQYKAYYRAYEHELQRINLVNLSNQGQTWAGWALLAHMTAGKLAKLKVSRDDESEADYLGLMMMAEAGVHPDYAPAMCSHMALAVGDTGKFWTFFSSDHPRWATREENAWRGWTQAMSVFRTRWSESANSPGGAPPPIVRLGAVRFDKDKKLKTVTIEAPYLVRNLKNARVGIIFGYKNATVPGALADYRYSDGSLGIARDASISTGIEEKLFTVTIPATALATKERKLDAQIVIWIDRKMAIRSQAFRVEFPKP